MSCTETPGLHNDGCDCKRKSRYCPGCGKDRQVTGEGKYFKHKDPDTGRPCDFSQTEVPKEETCPPSSDATSTDASSATPPEADAPTPTAPDAASGTASCPTSSTEAADATSSPPAPAPDADSGDSAPPLPGIQEYAERLNNMATEQASSYRERVNSRFSQPTQPFSQPEHPEVEQPPLLDNETARSFAGLPPSSSSFSQPAGRRSEAPAIEMTDLGKEITTRFKEIFYSYQNRKSEDNRSAQVTMGPSGMGTPCDRRLAVELMRLPPVNPGGDSWASYVGTCIHAGMEEVFQWANADSGRFATETRVEFESRFVPKGTADLMDRMLFVLEDFKCQGRWSRNKLKSQGPSRTYRVQAHVYAFGARQRGERIDYVAIVSLPRDESTLDDMYVWVEPYNPSIAKEAFERVERIGEQVEPFIELTTREKALKAKEFDVADDCRFCPAYLPGARDITDGCDGKR